MKALLSQWDEAPLGPNPFITTGETAGVFLIEFNPSHLSDCCNMQLQKVGELCEDGKALLHAMAGTITFSVDMEVAHVLCLPVLFAHSSHSVQQQACEFDSPSIRGSGGKRGFVGHDLLRYRLVAQWWPIRIELSKVNTSEDSVIQAAQRMYGQAYTDNWKQNLRAAATPEAKTAVLKLFKVVLLVLGARNAR